MNDKFLCKCGHWNSSHTTAEDALKYRNHVGRMCIEYGDTIYINGVSYHHDEHICGCDDFIPDNLATLELLSNVK